MRRHGRERRTGGVTLVEMMVAGALLSVVTAYLLGSFSANQKSYVVVDQTTEAQQNMRAIAGFVEADLRHTGFMVPLGAAFCGVDNVNAPDRLYLSDSSTIEPGNQVDADFGAAVAGTNLGAGASTLNVDDVVIDGTPSYDTDGNGINDADFQIGAGVIVTDVLDPLRGAACGTVVDVDPVADTIDVDILSGALPAAGTGELVAVPAHEYVVNANLQLLRNGIPFAQGVEDFQFSIFIDANDDNLVDPIEYRGDGVGADYAANAVDHSDAREVRINIVMRTRSQEIDWQQGQFQVTENRVPIAGNDGFRRRVYTSTTGLRNVMSRQI